MLKQIISVVVIVFLASSCEKVKEQPAPYSGKTYPIGVSFSDVVYPMLNRTCENCHGGEYSPSSIAFSSMQTHSFNILKSQPISSIETDSAAYWKEADSLVRKSEFYLLLHKSHFGKVDELTEASLDSIYGWIIEGGKNN